jgi:hypothetical protein
VWQAPHASQALKKDIRTPIILLNRTTSEQEIASDFTKPKSSQRRISFQVYNLENLDKKRVHWASRLLLTLRSQSPRKDAFLFRFTILKILIKTRALGFPAGKPMAADGAIGNEVISEALRRMK